MRLAPMGLWWQMRYYWCRKESKGIEATRHKGNEEIQIFDTICLCAFMAFCPGLLMIIDQVCSSFLVFCIRYNTLFFLIDQFLHFFQFVDPRCSCLTGRAYVLPGLNRAFEKQGN